MSASQFHKISEGWRRFWFTPQDPAPLALVRMLAGIVLLYTYAVTWPWLLDAIGPQAWLDNQAVTEVRHLSEGVTRRDYSDPQAPLVPASGPLRDAAGNLQRDVTGNLVLPADKWAGTFSLWFFVPNSPAVVHGFYALFIIAAVCLVAGLGTRLAIIVCWLGHVSYLQRGIVIYSGMDAVLLTLLFYLCFAPAGATASVDSWRSRAKGLRVPSSTGRSVSAGVVLRLMQLHLCLIYFAAGTAKLQGPTWWNGTAVYLTMMSPEYGAWDMSWMAQREWLWQSISLAGGWLTLAVEIGFAFLVWHKPLRPYVLAAALLMHLAAAATTGLSAFQAAMVAGLVAFVPGDLVHKMFPRWIARPVDTPVET
jgi:hypothetical protein